MSRIAAIQVLYQHEFFNRQQNIEELVKKIVFFYKDTESIEDLDAGMLPIKIRLNYRYLTNIVDTTIQNIHIIDAEIISHLTSTWKIETLPILLLSILRVRICEIRFFTEVPYKVVINEFTNIASSMLDEKEISFVNSVLDDIATSHEPQ